MKSLLPLLLFVFIIPATWCYAQKPVMWGMTSEGGANNDGVIFKVDAAGKETVVYNFGDQANDGSGPFGSLFADNNGLLYGLTFSGGAYGAGTIFSFDTTTGTETIVSDFNGADGEFPDGSLFRAGNGLLYGTTFFGGANSDGVIFSFNITTGIEADVHDLGSGTDGAYPFSTLMQAGNNLLYGVTHGGGAYNMGIIFSYNILTGAETDAYDFGGGADGNGPLYGPLLQLNDSLLYGTTQHGGAFSGGTIYNYNINSGTETVLYSLGNGNDGNCPDGTVIKASNGLLYGTTLYGGVDSGGIIYSYDIATNTEAIVHSFGKGTDGQTAYGTLIQSCNSLLYGMTGYGGVDSSGIIFSYNIATGAEEDLHDFGSGADGATPYGNLIIGEDSISLLSVTPQSPKICSGASVALTASGGLTYTWTPVPTLSDSIADSVTVSPTATTIYSVVSGCAAAADTVKVIPVSPLIITPPSAVLCTGLSATLVVNGDNSEFVWSPSASLNSSTGDSVIATPSVTTTYQVTGKDSLGCDASGSVVVKVVASPNQPTFYQRGDTLISSSVNDNQWYLNGVALNDTSQHLVITDTGEYWVVVSNEANGCSTASDSMDITTLTGIEQLSVNNNQLSMYPNPTSGEINITSTKTIYAITVTNLLGQTMLKSPLGDLGVNQFTFELKDEGMYFVTVNSASETSTSKIIVSK